MKTATGCKLNEGIHKCKICMKTATGCKLNEGVHKCKIYIKKPKLEYKKRLYLFLCSMFFMKSSVISSRRDLYFSFAK